MGVLFSGVGLSYGLDLGKCARPWEHVQWVRGVRRYWRCGIFLAAVFYGMWVRVEMGIDKTKIG
ncbi:hypothetical protein JQC72_15990 [Polycladomyces sp. WAk]|uniref:Uncharacterized protein n=1 Tax=Polycladomyces zharkentensis TaxID=2807616 RepID=A0ABS2WN80_9BACL|nr:hypothetical protein [Polycladomyces sp. WAk]MBN2910993.1 hypothetical protein [Polycladomyces sp. WAk]